MQSITEANELATRLVASGVVTCEGIDFAHHVREWALPPLGEGVYRLEITAGDVKRDAIISVMPYMMLLVEDIPQECIVMLLDNKTGHPIVHEELVLSDKEGKRVQSLRTDAHGLCRIKSVKKSEPLYISVTRVEAYPMQHRIGFVGARDRDVPTSVQLFTDRSLYRPGQKLYFSAILYRIDSDEHRVIAGVNVPVELVDHDGNVVWRDTLLTDRYGSVSGEVLLPEKASLGSWYLRVHDKELYNSRMIEVAEYKRPQFHATCDAVAGIYSYGDSVRVQGSAQTFTGMPLMQAVVKYAVRRSSYYYGSSEEIASGSTTTDAQGRFVIDFVADRPADLIQQRWGSRYVVEAVVTSAAGESQLCETVVTVAGTGVQFRFDVPAYICLSNENSVVLSMVNGNGTLLDLPFDISLYALAGSEIGESVSMMQRADAPLWHTAVAGKAEAQRIALPVHMMPSGAYRLIATTTHAGEQYADSAEFVFYTPADAAPAVATPLWLPVTHYEIANGDVARIMVGSSLRDVMLSCFITDGSKRTAYRSYVLDNSNVTMEIPLNKCCDDVITVMFVMLREGEVYRKWATIRRKQPHLQLTITPITFRDKTRPGSMESWQFAVRDHNGKAVDALFMAELYDASLDVLRSHTWRFVPQYTPYALYRPTLYNMWEYRRNSNLYLNYLNEYAQAHCVELLQPQLNNYLPLYFYNYDRMVMRSSTAMGRNTMKTIPMATEAAVDYKSESGVVDEVALTAQSQAVGNAPIDYRSDMNETAFFYPHLVTDKQGNVMLQFTLPESNTTWNFLSLAVTPQLQYGAYNATVVSTKPMMVSPNLPRFVRQGDRAVIAVNVTNTTDATLEGEAFVTLYHVDSDNEIVTRSCLITVPADTVITLHFKLDIPRDLSLVGVRVGATTPSSSDGEQHLLPLLPARTVVTESKPFFVQPTTADTVITFDAMQDRMQQAGVENIRVTLEYCDNPQWYAVTALPPLAQPRTLSATAIMASLYANRVATALVARNTLMAQAIATWREGSAEGTLPLAMNEELKQLLLQQTPWLLEADNAAEELQQIATLLDTERADALYRTAVENLQALQSVGGGWSWYNGMQPSFVITLNVVQGLLQLAQWGESSSDVTAMLHEGVKYLDSEYLRRNSHQPEGVDYNDLCYLYVRSGCLDVPMPAEVLALFKTQLDTVAAQWYRCDEVEKAYAAIALYRFGKEDVAQEIVGSLREYATHSSSQGMFWANNRSNTFYRNSAVQTHCAIYKAFAMVSPRSAEQEAMRQWLLLQKQTQSWGNLPSTLDAVDILLQSGSLPLTTGIDTHLTWGDRALPQDSVANSIMGYEKCVREGNAITPADACVTLTSHDNHPSWGAIYWQYSQDITAVASSSNAYISLSREYYVERNGVLVPIAHTHLGSGDVVTVRHTIYLGRDMEFMTLVDNRPACFEPVHQLPQLGYNGTSLYYSEPTDATHNFYFDFMPHGTHVIEYKVYVDRAGSYQAGVATLQSYYAPQYVAHTHGSVVNVEMR